MFFSMWAASVLTFLFSNLLYMGIYKANNPFFEKYKIEKDELWPWQEDPEGWRDMLWKSIKVVGFNEFVLYPAILFSVSTLNNHKLAYKIDVVSLPSPWTFLWQLVFCLYLEDLVFSCFHRLLHHKSLYKHVHKLHHQYSQTVSIAAIYAHPIEFALGNVLPAGLPPALLGPRIHLVTILTWIVFRIIATTNGHSGYEFPWIPWDLLPMKGSPQYHDYHHSGGDFSGNFSGQTTVLDTIWGTNKKYYRELMLHLREKDMKKEG
jgi:sterol desaturase/sphingolipid hydroxylase (fatty acid hydroxylase superfamily)